MPQAIECFLESTSFEDAIRTAIYLGGDSDTIATITGAIAEAYYGVPAGIEEKALAYLDEELRAIYDEWTAFAPEVGEHLKVLTKYIGKIDTAESLGEWIIDRENDGTPEHPKQWPFVGYSGLVISFEEAMLIPTTGINCSTFSELNTMMKRMRVNDPPQTYQFLSVVPVRIRRLSV